MIEKTTNKLKLIIAPDSRLNLVSKPVDTLNDNTFEILRQMLEIMYTRNGIGLAAPQVGILKRLIVMDCRLNEKENKVYKLINPRILDSSQEVSEYEEGCLSLPTQYAKVIRPSQVKIQFINEEGKEITKVFRGLESTCIQHEIDHLDGKLFVDHVSRLRKNIIIKKLIKYKKKNI